MYTLRKVIDNVQSNQEIGKDYSVVEREISYDEFRKAFEVCFGFPHVADDDSKSNESTKNCYMLLFHNNGSGVIPLYKKQSNYIMSESGQTFSNLTYK